jgi:hypothetical protein
MTTEEVQKHLRSPGIPEIAKRCASFFKIGPGDRPESQVGRAGLSAFIGHRAW